MMPHDRLHGRRRVAGPRVRRGRAARASPARARSGLRRAARAAAGAGRAARAADAHWQAFFAALGPAARGGAGRRTGGAARHACSAASARTASATTSTRRAATPAGEWPLQLLPLIVGPGDWAAIERGVAQRARLLNAMLADLYGPQTLLREAVLPPALVFAHPQLPAAGARRACRPAACTCTSPPSTSRAAPTAAGGWCRSARRRPRGWATCWRTGCSSRASSPKPSASCACSTSPPLSAPARHAARCAPLSRRRRALRASCC